MDQGNDNSIKYADIMYFIFKNKVPKDKQITYTNFVYDYRSLKGKNTEYT